MHPFFMAKYFIALRKRLEVLASLSADNLIYEATLQKSLQTLVVKLNTQSQLFNEGIDSKGRRLDSIGGGYSPYTIEIKKEKGLPYDRVTLRDTGEFYDSFEVQPFKGGFEIVADAIKQDETGRTTDLTEEWGLDIIGLTDESKNILINYYRDAIIRKLRQKF